MWSSKDDFNNVAGGNTEKTQCDECIFTQTTNVHVTTVGNS